MLKVNFLNSKFFDSIKESGCPLCFLEIDFLEKYIGEIISEYNSDNNVISKFKKSYGFCPEHNNILIKLLKKNYHLSKSSVARLYEKTIPLYLDSLKKIDDKDNVLKNILLKLNKKNKSHKSKNECMCCSAVKKENDNNILTLIELLNDDYFKSEYYRSDGICIPHFKKSLDFIEESGIVSPVKDFIINDQKERLELLEYRLESLNDKKNFYNNEIINEEEAKSWYEAIWRFSGCKF
ncbi:DUF6062 family protein [Natronospora cellulosivora (SeqCode)]